MKKFNKNNAFTLVEVLVTIILIALIAMISLYLYTNSYSNLVYSGQKDKAVTEASNILDLIYSRQPVTDNSWEDIINDLNEENNFNLVEVDCNNLEYIDNVVYGYCIDNSFVDGFKFTVVVYYLNGKKYVTLTSFIRKE